MAKRPIKKKRQLEQLARKVLDVVAPDAIENKPAKNPAAVELGRLGGIKGGRARADKLTAKKRSEIAESC